MKKENRHLSIPEEETRKENRTLRRRIGHVCIAAALTMLVFFKTTDNSLCLYIGAALAILGAILIEKNKQETKIVRSEKEIEENKTVLVKNAILVKVHANASAEKKLANGLIAAWTVLIAGIVAYACYKHGVDYAIHNWPGSAILLAFPWTVYIVWRIATGVKAKNDVKALIANNIIVLNSRVNSVQHVGRHANIPMVTFKSELYGKFEQMVSHGCLAQAGDNYYLILRKHKEKYKLIDSYSEDYWELDEELTKYLVKEV